MSNRDGFIWLDGKMVEWSEAKVHVLTHTLHYGMGVFEGVRAYDAEQGTAIFKLEEHTTRLINSAKIMNMAMPFSKEELDDAQKLVVRENNLKSAYLRPMAFYGSEGMGLRADNLKTHVMVAAWEWGAYMGEENLTRGIKVATSSYTRHHPNISMTKAKANGAYINSMLALQEAISHGCDEALLLDVDGYVSEGSGENFFIVKDGTIYTPFLKCALDGITRKTIIQLANEADYAVVEKDISRDEVYIADEAFFTGTAAEVTPIRELDNRPIGAGIRGPITKLLQAKYFDVVHGRSSKYLNWLSLVKE
jgi:branched-chain amino acid aminotransferase